MNRPDVMPFFDPATGTLSYVVSDPKTRQAVIIDPVLDFDPKAGRTRTDNADTLIQYVRSQRLEIVWILETHAHADHLSAAQYLKSNLGGKIAIGAGIERVQNTFKTLFNLEPEFRSDGSQFDHLFCDDERFALGEIEARILHVPGHTPADIAYLIGDALFVGDTLFMPDVGSARCDFPGGDAATLYRSVQKMYALPDHTRFFACHDYPPTDRAPAWESTIGEQKAHNLHLRADTTEADFIALRQARDATLAAPVLLLPSIQVNIRAGHLPPAEANGVHYLKIPLNQI